MSYGAQPMMTEQDHFYDEDEIDKIVDRARAQGTPWVIEAREDELFVDLDQAVDPGVFIERWALIVRVLHDRLEGARKRVVGEADFDLDPIKCWAGESAHFYESKTPGHMHVVLDLPCSLSLMARVALQATLGSDPKREILIALGGLGRQRVLFFRSDRKMVDDGHGIVVGRVSA